MDLDTTFLLVPRVAPNPQQGQRAVGTGWYRSTMWKVSHGTP